MKTLWHVPLPQSLEDCLHRLVHAPRSEFPEALEAPLSDDQDQVHATHAHLPSGPGRAGQTAKRRVTFNYSDGRNETT